MHTPYYEKPRFKLYRADCLDILAGLPENSVDMIFADPPYLLSNGGSLIQAKLGSLLSYYSSDSASSSQ